MIHHHEGPEEKRVSTLVSAVFMFCVGLSTPALTLDGPGSVLSTDMAGHIAAVSALMILGKMFPLFCYRDEADWQTRLALSLGMCPRGEVGAGIIVISIHAGISGPAVELAVVCLVINLVLSGAFVTWTRQLTRASQERVAKLKEEAARAKAERRKAKKEALERRARREREAAEELARENALLPKEVFTLNGVPVTVEPGLLPAIMSAAPGVEKKGAQSDSDAASSISVVSHTLSSISVSTAGIPIDNDMDIMQATRSAPKMKRQQTSALEFSSQNNDKPVLIVIFTCNLLVGVVLSQVASAMLPHHDHHHDDHHDTEAVWYDYYNYTEAVSVVTMTLLSFIMIGVGCEFVIDKTNLKAYGKDYLVAMTAAGFPWLFVGAWFIWMLPGGMWWWGEALFTARFAAPTSAGILFTMLRAAGLQDTWLFRKARVLAIFDDLDTILFMLPLKVIVSGMHWELGFDMLLLGLPLLAAWRYMHAISLPSSAPFKMLYAALIVTFCKGLHFLSKHQLEMEPIHLEVLLPAFVLGCILTHQHEGPNETRVSTLVSAFFMFCVGLSTPPLTLGGATSVLSVDMAGHIAAVTALMILGKMFPLFCYRDEADWQTRLALCLGMCPRGEVGAGIIVISIEAGISGPAVELAVVCLVINLVLSGAFVTWTRQLARSSESRVAAAKAARRQAKKEAIERRAQRVREKAEKRERKEAKKLA